MAISRALVRVAGGVGGRSRIFQSGWKAVKCMVTSGSRCSTTQPVMASISASVSLAPGISRLVISNHTPRLVLEVLERLEHRLQPPGADPPVEVLGEPLEIDVGGVHVPVELDPRLGPDVAGRDRDGLDTDLVTGLRHIDGVLHED